MYVPQQNGDFEDLIGQSLYTPLCIFNTMFNRNQIELQDQRL